MLTIFAYFLTDYFNKTKRIEDIDKSIEAFKEREDASMQQELVNELRDAINKADYRCLVPLIEEHSGKEVYPFFAELLVKYVHDRLTDTPTTLNAVFMRQLSKIYPMPSK